MNRFLIFSAIALLSICSGAYAEAATEEERIANLEVHWSELWGDRNLDGVMALWAQNSVLMMPGSAPILGIEDIREVTRTMLEPDDEVSWRSDFALVSPGGDMAYDYGTTVTKLADGSTVESYYLVVWVKENDEWKVAAEMFN